MHCSADNDNDNDNGDTRQDGHRGGFSATAAVAVGASDEEDSDDLLRRILEMPQLEQEFHHELESSFDMLNGFPSSLDGKLPRTSSSHAPSRHRDHTVPVEADPVSPSPVPGAQGSLSAQRRSVVVSTERQQCEETVNVVETSDGEWSKNRYVQGSDGDTSQTNLDEFEDAASIGGSDSASDRSFDWYHDAVPEEPSSAVLTDEQADRRIARSLQKLSLEERQSAINDIHGVADITEETPELVRAKCKELQSHVTSLTATDTDTDTGTGTARHQAQERPWPAYDYAMKHSPEYVTNTKFLLMFLRADDFDALAAAKRLLNFLEAKAGLFGIEKVRRDIGISDLWADKADRKSLESGMFQLLPTRDSAGRAVFVVMPGHHNYKVPENFLRAYYYIVMTALEDEATQRLGIVKIGWNVGPMTTIRREIPFNVLKLKRVLPVRIVGMHYCYDKMVLRLIVGIAAMVLSLQTRVRFRSHYGTPESIVWELQSFGIPKSVLPFSTTDGSIRPKQHLTWLKKRRQQESKWGLPCDWSRVSSEAPGGRASGDLQQTARKHNGPPESIIVVPGLRDVLLGRGKPIQESTGNLKFHLLLDQYEHEYETARKFDKMRIAGDIVDSVHAYGGRFLKTEEAGWMEVPDKVARDKVSHTFRTRRSSSSANAAGNRSSATMSARSLDRAAIADRSEHDDGRKRIRVVLG